MIFALSDFLLYLLRRGRYARSSPHSEMGAAFMGDLPSGAVALLQPGDTLFTSLYGSPIAWAIMYLTSSEVNHVAMYMGSGQIAHATLGGLVVDGIEVLYGPAVRLLPVRVDETEERRREIVVRVRSRIGERYGWSAIRRKFTAIVIGRDRPYFRWRFASDVILVLATADLISWPLMRRLTFLWLAAPYLLVVVVNLIRWKWDPLPTDDTYMNPQDMLIALKARRGRRIADAEALARQQALARRS